MPRADPGEIEDLAASVREHGLLMPVLIEPDGAVRGGVRRLAALKSLGRRETECLIIPPSCSLGSDPALVQLIENLQRTDLSPVEEARAFRRILDRTGWRQVRLARELGISEARVSLALNLIEAPPEVVESVERGEESAYTVKCAFSKKGRRDGRADQIRRRAELMERRVRSGDIVPARFASAAVRVPKQRLPEGVRARAFTDRIELTVALGEDAFPLARVTSLADAVRGALKAALGGSEGPVITALREARAKALLLDGESVEGGPATEVGRLATSQPEEGTAPPNRSQATVRSPARHRTCSDLGEPDPPAPAAGGRTAESAKPITTEARGDSSGSASEERPGTRRQ
jgi:ParB/RepB/Spo0J family partition protein